MEAMTLRVKKEPWREGMTVLGGRVEIEQK